MKFLKMLMATILVLIASNTSFAQRKNLVTGSVYDVSGEPLIGVSVFEKGTSNGTITDDLGAFTLNITKRDATLSFTYLGFVTSEMKVRDGDRITVTMKEDALYLEDVVVIGYGTVKKSDLTGSVASAKQEVMEDRQVLSVEDALRGQLAGVRILSTDGAPGAEMNIRVRGTSSINASNSPLYVIDGVLMESTDIGPSEIESIEILKDASSSAIYGSRGANGVVIIKTKQGTRGAPRINISSSVSLQEPVRLYEMMNAEEFAKYNYWGPGSTVGSTKDYYDIEGNPYTMRGSGCNALARYEEILNGSFTTDTDWQKEMLRKAWVQDHRLSISGADENTTYSVMGSMLDQDGTLVNSGMVRYNVRANFTQTVSDWLKLGVNTSGSQQNNKSVAGNVIKNMLSRSPMKSAYSDALDFTDSASEILLDQNPLSQARKVTDTQNRMTAMLKGWADIIFLKVFRLNISGSYNFMRIKQENYYPSDVNIGSGSTAGGRALTRISEKVDWLNENILYYTPGNWGDSKFDAMLGVTFQGTNTYSLQAENDKFGYQAKGIYNMSYGVVPIVPVNAYGKSTMMSYLARMNYSLKDKYLFTASVRADGSSRLAEGHKWGYFPSAAFAWRAGEEPWIKALNIFSNLKFRASAGISGNQAISMYQTKALTTASGYPMDGLNPTFGLIATRTANPDLTWEKSTQYDMGLDFGFFQNRVSVTVDAYLKQTRDLLLRESIPTYSGYETRWTNRGRVDNKGLEITILATPVDNKVFTWDSQFNISFNRSEVKYIAESGYMILTGSSNSASNFGILVEGKPIGQWYGYEDHGVYRTLSELQASGVTTIFGGTGLRAGFTNYTDQNGDHQIDEADRVIIGCAEPKFMGGWTNSFRVGQFGLDLGLEFRYGGTIFNSTRMYLEGAKSGSNNQTKRAAKYGYYPTLYDPNDGTLWHQGNEDIAYIHTPMAPNEPQDYSCRTLYVEDGSYLRINDVTLSYTLKKEVSKKLKIQNLKIFANVKNAYVFTNYTGYDPDVNSVSSAGKDLMPGLDDMAYPRTRNWTLGVNLTF